MKVLCKYLGGSHSYGLNTEFSDKDERFLFLHTEISKILGLTRHDHECRQNSDVDSFGWELRHFLSLLRNGNTMCLEMLFNTEWISISPEFQYIQSQRENLITVNKLFSCLKGYCHSERSLVLGKRTGQLGSKRKIALDKYGYSYKNLVQFLRLCLCGKEFFQSGVFPVNIRTFDRDNLLFNIKINPGQFNLEFAVKIMDSFEAEMVASFDNKKVDFRYNEDLANKICYDLYMPILIEKNK